MNLSFARALTQLKLLPVVLYYHYFGTIFAVFQNVSILPLVIIIIMTDRLNDFAITLCVAVSTMNYTVCVTAFLILTYHAFIWVRNFKIVKVRGISFPQQRNLELEAQYQHKQYIYFMWLVVRRPNWCFFNQFRESILFALVDTEIIRDLDVIVWIELAKSDITCIDTSYIFQHVIINSQIMMHSHLISQLGHDNIANYIFVCKISSWNPGSKTASICVDWWLEAWREGFGKLSHIRRSTRPTRRHDQPGRHSAYGMDRGEHTHQSSTNDSYGSIR